MKQLLFILIVLFAKSSLATNYYVAATGNDLNNGLTASSAWQTVNKVNSFAFAANDNILFKRGDTFYGTIIPNRNNLFFGSYGTGSKPIISGFTTITAWTNEGGGIYSKIITSEAAANMVTINGVQYGMGRYPDASYLTYESLSGNTSITDNTLGATTDWKGAEVVIRKNAWTMDRCLITNHTFNTLTYTSLGSTKSGSANFGYFIQNDLRTLTNYGEWFHNFGTGKFYMYFGAVDPATKTINVATKNNCIGNIRGYDNISIDNIACVGSINNSIDFTGTNNACIIQNCDVYFAGKNGINFGTDGIDNLIAGNTIRYANRYGIYDYGKTTKITGNTITNIGNILGQSLGSDGYCGIYSPGLGVLINYNTIRNTGYNGIIVRYSGASTVQYNLIDTVCTLLDDGGGIYTSSPDATPRLIDHNIILNVRGNFEGTDHKGSLSAGIYLDDETTNMVCTNNTVAYSPFAGIKLHRAHNNTVTGNTTYDNFYNFNVEDYQGNLVRNNSLRNNIFFAKTAGQYALRWRTVTNDIPLFGTADSNYYARPINDNLTILLQPSTGAVTHSLATWKTYIGQDANSRKAPKTITTTSELIFEYNASNSSKTISFPGLRYMDVKGINYDNSVTIPAWSSKILIANGKALIIGNQAPKANAGTNQMITLPANSTTLTGSGEDSDGTIVSYAWLKISGPASGTIVSSNTASTVVNNLVQGIFQYELTVTDNDGAIGKDTIQVTVNPTGNLAPKANAGPDKTITLPANNTTLNGNGTDTDGTITTYEWSKIAGPVTGTISTANTASTSITNLVEGVYKFELTVTDNNGATGKDTIQIKVNAAVNMAPVANAGIDKIITLPTNTTTLAGSGTDTDGTISSYTWIKISGQSIVSIASANASTCTLNNLVQGVFQFELTVIDNNGAIGKDTVQVIVNAAPNKAPVANAGINKTITLPTNTNTLTGNGTDTDGIIAGYLWTKISGPVTGAIVTPTSAVTAINNLVQGIYLYELAVTDNNGAVAKDTVSITVNAAPNLAPLANAGINKVITLPVNNTTLNGSGTDFDGTLTSFLWVKISGPATGAIASPNLPVSSVNSLVQGIHEFELTVTDNNGAMGKDTVLVTVNSAPNVAPVANAGTDKVLLLPINSTTLTGTGTDIDGTITSYSWLKISGPALGTITTPNAANTTLTDLVQGIYKFELIITDNKGAIAKDIVQVTVNAATNQTPIANAGPDKSIALPINNTTLTGTGTDADGTIVSYNWVKISGPTVIIVSSNAAITAINNLLKGVYRFQLTVKDNKGASGKDTIQITVNDSPNQAPLATAGTDQTITLPANTTTLTGNGTDPDGIITNYEWKKIAGPTMGSISSPNSSATSINNLVKGIYNFELTVIDNVGAVSKDTVQVTVHALPNQAPLADAGANQSIDLPTNNITLNGSGTDADGTITSFSWKKISGPAASNITTPNGASTSVSGLVQGIYNFEIAVTDDDAAVSKDTVEIRVNAALNEAPLANAGTNKSITLPVNSTTLTGGATDADGTISSYSWIKISGPVSGSMASPDKAETQVNSLVQGLYEFELTVTDNIGAIGSDTVLVTVNAVDNQAPVANAGNNKVITLPINSTTLNGIGTDADGAIATYEWKKISGPAAGSIASPTSAFTAINNLVQGIYKYELTVTDNNGAISKDIVQITVNAGPNQPPLANAGADQSITLPMNASTLAGTGTDADGTIASYNWIKISGPTVIIGSANTAISAINNLVKGVYRFQLTVKDNKGTSAKDTIQVTVNASPNQAPSANAGIDQTITLPTNIIALTGSGTDADGTIKNYEWIKIDGPASGIILSPNSNATSINNLIQGVYKFELTVTDNSGAISKDTVQVTVNAMPNQVPVANAGADLLIELPINKTILNGNGTDADGIITSYTWIKISGPTAGIITTPFVQSTSVDSLIQGIYNFELTVMDNESAITKDTIEVKVNPAQNQAPIASAGIGKVITLPEDSTMLTGSGTDSDGTIASYWWIKISGPTKGTIASPGTAITSINNLEQGIYQFELTVMDNFGAISRDIVQITVNSAPNQAPLANAGADQSISLPINYATLNGTGTDADGTISSYKWLKISGPSFGEITSTHSANTFIYNLTLGQYLYELSVSDNNGAVSTDTLMITVISAPNLAPVANAGMNTVIKLPTNTTTLNGSGFDTDGIIANYEWVKIAGPVSGIIVTPNSGITALNNLVQGEYQYQLTVIDNMGAISKDTVTVTVIESPNLFPEANAGTDKTITLPTNSTTLSGNGIDSDGIISSYSWIKITGPAAGTIETSNGGTTVVNNLIQGIYQFELTVIDNNGGYGKDTVQVIVYPAVNLNPFANAGTDKTITLPTNSTTLNGNGTDSDGIISSYSWVKITGPAAGTIATANGATTAINNLIQGIYQFELTVIDNNGGYGKDTVQVIVNAQNISNQLPTAMAGNDINIVLPTNNVTLKGTGNDPDGLIVSYNWKVINGPTGSFFSSPNSPETKIENLFQGVYQVEFTVVDNSGGFTNDTISITVSSPRLSNDFSNQFKVYPNPVNDIANLDITTANKNTKLYITVVDLSGRTVKYKEFVTMNNNTDLKLDMTNLSNGFYIFTIRFDDGIILSTKIMKQSGK